MSTASPAPGPARVLSHLSAFPSPEDAFELSSSLPVESAVAWATLPEIAIKISIQAAVPVTERSAWPGRARNATRTFLRRRGPSLLRTGPALFLSTSVQTDRVLTPIRRGLEAEHGPAVPFVLPGVGPGAGLAAHREAYRVLADYRRWMASHRIPEPPGLEEEIVKSSLFHRRALECGLTDRGITALVVATQHNGTTRAVLAAANQSGVATCYVPHAPVADNPFYRDLPVHYALLRGEAEIDFYRGIGVDDVSGLTVIGQPGTEVANTTTVPQADHVTYAASSRAEDILLADIAVIEKAVDRPVEVCLHPRTAPVEGSGVFPRHWTVHPPGATMPVLARRGTYALLQHSSGVGLEAMKAGVDVIDLCPGGTRPNYPYLAAPHVQLAHDSAELRVAVDAVEERRATATDRMTFAGRWNSRFDPEATEAAIEAITRAASSPPPGTTILDGWPAR